MKNLDTGVSECIAQLADRADELDEGHTAFILRAIVAHRIIGADDLMAMATRPLAENLAQALIASLEKDNDDGSSAKQSLKDMLDEASPEEPKL